MNSLSDLFHPDVPFDFIDRVFAVMALCPQHTFQILTKRPERMREYLSDRKTRRIIWGFNAAAIWDLTLGRHGSPPDPGWPLPNVWLGVSAENQATADERIPHLLNTPAVVRFVSCEPLLGPVDLTHIGHWRDVPLTALEEIVGHVERPRLDWIVLGSESGHRRRECDLDWVRAIRDDCQSAGVPFFLKQLYIEGKRVHMPELDCRIWDEYPTTAGGQADV